MFDNVSNQLQRAGDPNDHPVLMRAEWNIKAIRDGEVIHEETKENLIVKNGRINILDLIFGLSNGATVLALGAGASATAATVDDTRLNYEYINTASPNGVTKRYPLTNTSGGALGNSDVVADNFTDSTETPSINYYEKIVVQATILTTDPNIGEPFQEYGLFTNNNCPTTPTGTSGLMFNHLVANSAIIKDSNTQIVVTITLRV